MYHTPFDFDSLALLVAELPDSLKNLRFAGRFEEEAAEIDRLLTPGVHPEFEPIMKKRLELERIIADGLSRDYSLTWEDMLGLFRDNYPGFEEKDLLALIDSGHADYLIGQGTYPQCIRFQDDAYANLTDCCEGYLWELTHPGEKFVPEFSELRHDNMKFMRENGSASWRFTVTESVAPKEIRPGKLFRVWLPFPSVTPEQSGIELLSSNRPVTISDGPIRTAYAAFPVTEDGDNKLEITFRYTCTAVYHDLDPARAAAGCSSEAAEYLGELLPHIAFTPYFRMLADRLTEGERNPLFKARQIYDYVTSHVRYSYMREYRFLDNIPMYGAVNGRGDCGLQALLFITLCRLAGVPARWQSGSAARPTSIGSHDWAQFYVEPWGWLPCDPSYGGGMKRSGDTEGWNWYFGNLDPYRMIACTEFQRQLDPPKTFFRLDPYDNQTGEAEYEDLRLNGSDVVRRKFIVESERP
jgi:transglutaminase-like putative cysteine protease